MSPSITATVVDIPDASSVVLDKGTNNGVKKGMSFMIYAEGDEILDMNGKSLGRLEIPKVEVEVVYAMPTMSMARHFETHTYSMIDMMRSVDIHSTKLPVDEKEISNRKFEAKIHKGDKARQVE